MDEFESFLKTVQKNLGKNLNDLMKGYPEKASEIIEERNKDSSSQETQWIIKHRKYWFKKK